MQLKLQAQGQKWTSAGSEALWKRFKSASERFVPVIPEALSKRFGSALRCAFVETLQSALEALQNDPSRMCFQSALEALCVVLSLKRFKALQKRFITIRPGSAFKALWKRFALCFR